METEGRTRRQFLWTGGVGAVSLAGAAGWAAGRAQAQKKAGGPTEATAAGKRKLKVGFPTYMFKFYTLDQTLAMTRRLKVKYLCLRSFHLPLNLKPAEIAAAVAKVKQAGIEPYAGGVITMRREDDVSRAFEYAKAAGFGLITVKPSPSVLPLIDRKVKEYDIKAAIHNHGPEDRLYPTPLAAYEKIKGLDRRVGLCHDTGHTQRTGTDPAEATAKTADRLMDVHLKDVDAAVARAHSTELGRGVVDIPKFLQTLRKINYTGVVGIEYEKNMKDLLPGLAESVGYTRGVLAVLEGRG